MADISYLNLQYGRSDWESIAASHEQVPAALKSFEQSVVMHLEEKCKKINPQYGEVKSDGKPLLSGTGIGKARKAALKEINFKFSKYLCRAPGVERVCARSRAPAARLRAGLPPPAVPAAS